MDKSQQEVCQYIRSLTSEAAADWLIDTYKLGSPNTGGVYKVLAHRSWSKGDQIRLANYFLQNIPHRSGLGYETFLSFMSLPAFIAVVQQHMPSNPSERELLAYHLGPALEARAHLGRHQASVENFMRSLS